MEIKEFTKEVIGDITDAVIEINSEKCNSGVVVCTSRFSNRGEIYSITEDGKMVRNVDFNLSVVVSGKNEANAGLKISIARVGIGNETTNSTTSFLFRSLFLLRSNPIVKNLRKFQGITTHVAGPHKRNCIL